MRCSISKSRGVYGWRLNGQQSDEECCVTISYNDGDKTLCLSERWPLDEEPVIEDLPPSEVVELIAERLKSYWINTSREAKLAQITQFKERIVEWDKAWAHGMITVVNDEIDSLMRRRSYFESLVEQ